MAKSIYQRYIESLDGDKKKKAEKEVRKATQKTSVLSQYREAAEQSAASGKADKWTGARYTAEKGLSGIVSAGKGIVNAGAAAAGKELTAKKNYGQPIRNRDEIRQDIADIKDIWKGYKENGLLQTAKGTLFEAADIARMAGENARLLMPGMREADAATDAMTELLVSGIAKKKGKTKEEVAADLTDKVYRATEPIYAEKNAEIQRQAAMQGRGAQIAGNVAEVVGNMMPSIAATAITKNPEIGLAAMGVSAGGNAAKEAYDNGADAEQAFTVGAAKGLVEVGTEKLFGGVNVFGKGTADDLIEKGLGAIFKNAPKAKKIASAVVEILGENVEEALSDWAGGGIDRAVYDKDAESKTLLQALAGQSPTTEEGAVTLLSTLALRALGLPGQIVRNRILNADGTINREGTEALGDEIIEANESKKAVNGKIEELIQERAKETGRSVEEIRAETEKLRAVAMSANSEQRINSLAEQIAQKENITTKEAKQRLTDMGVKVNEQNENSDGSTERNAVFGADGQSREAAGVVEESGPEKAADQRAAADERRNRASGIRQVGTETLIKAGTNRPSVRVFTRDMYDDEMRTWEQRARERGYQVSYVAGQIEGYDHGELVYGRGVIEGKRIIIQADNVNYSIEQIMEHELGHAEETAELNAEVEKLIRERFSEEEFDGIVEAYIRNLEGYSREEILSEIVQDARAGINAFGKNLEQYKETAREVYDRARENAVSREANGERETRGPSEEEAQEKFSREDAEYLELAKDPEANRDKLQEIVDKAAKAAGYTSRLVHGTTKEFYSFEPKGTHTHAESAFLGSWFSDSQRTARAYSTPQHGDFRNEEDWDKIAKQADEIMEGLQIAENNFAYQNDYWNLAEIGKMFKKYLPEEYKELTKIGVFKEGEKFKPLDKTNYSDNIETFNEIRRRVSDWREWWNELWGIRIHPVHFGKDMRDMLDSGVIRSLARGEISPRIIEVYVNSSNFAVAQPPFQKDEEKTLKIKSAKRRGKNGIIFNGMKDGGEKSNHYVVFDPKLIKSANPVTYDDAGNVIPLSERFNQEKKDIRWSRGETVGQLTETEAEMLENASAAMEEENRQALMNGGYRYDMVLGQKGDKIRAVIQVFENRDGNRTPVYGDQQTFDSREEAVKWLTDTAAEHMIEAHGNKMTFASIVENRTMTREEATAMAEENDYPMLRDKNGEEHRVVPEWTWVQNDNGQYGIVIGVDDMGQLTVLYENKRKGTQKTVTETVQGLGITYVDGQYSEDQGFTEAIRAEQDAEADASAEPDNWTPTEEEQRIADQLTEEAEELTNAEREEEPETKREQGEQMLRRLFGLDKDTPVNGLTPEMAEGIEDAIVDGYIRNAEKTTAEAPKEEKTGKVSTEVILPGEKSKIRKAWEAFKRLMDNTADSIHQIALKTGNKSLDGYFFHALAYKQRGADWIQKKRTNTMGASKGKSLNEILNPIRKKGNQYYIDFQNFLYHRLNIERMSRDVAKERAEAQRDLNDLARKNPNLATMTDERLKDLAAQYHAGDYDITEDAKMQLYSDYWEAKKRVKRMEDRRNKPIFGGEITAEKSKAVVENLLREHPEFAELAEEVYAYTRDLLQYRVDSGMISQKDADALLNTYKYYVPVAYNVSYEAAMQNGGITVSTTVKKAKGNYGGAQLLPLHTAMARQTMSVMRNSGIQRLANALAKQYKADRKALAKGKITAEEFEARWGDEILSIRESEAVWDEDLADNDDTAKQGNNVLTFIQDGKRYDMIMGKGMTAAMESLKPGAGHLEGPGILAGMVSAFKRVTTSLSPVFMITNPIRDVQDAIFYSTDAKKWAINYPKAIKEIAKKSGKYWDLYQAMGGVYSSFFDYATGEFENERVPKTKAGEAYKKAKQKIEMLNQGVEMAPRLAEFMTVLQNKSKDGNWTEADLMEAFEAAQDITTNFARSGSLGKIINRYFVPFWNPGVQGLSKAVRTVTETKGFKSWAMLAMKAAALGIAPTVINALVYRDDDEWDDIEDSVKANYYLFKSKDGIWIKIPKGRVIGAISTLATGVTEAARGDEVKAGELAKTAVGNVAPSNPLETSIFSTAFRVGLLDKDSPGKNWYGGDIESQRLRNYAPGKRYDESTDYISKWIGGKLDISPKKINYLLDQYSGIIGDIVLPYLTPKAERRIKNLPLTEAFAAKFTLDTASSNKVSGDFYDYSDELQYRKNEGGAADVLTNQYFSRMSGDVSDLYARVREIENDKVLKDKEKSAIVRELRKEITKKQKEIMETADRYNTVAAKYIKDNPQLDYTDRTAVAVWTEEYNARQSKDEYRITEEKAADKMKAVLYRETNREALGAEYALEVYSTDVYLKAAALNEAVKLSYDDFYDYYFAQIDLHADYDEDGKAISGSKKEKVVALIDSMDITDEQKDALLIAADYKPNGIKWSSGAKAKGKDGKSGGGKGGGRSGSEKAPKVKELDLPKYKDVIQAGMRYDPNATASKKTIAHYEAPKFDPFPKVKTADEIRRDKKAYVEYWKNKKF